MSKLQRWIIGLASSAISGAANAYLVLGLTPGVHTDPGQWTSALSAIAVGATIAIGHYVLGSPLDKALENGDSQGEK